MATATYLVADSNNQNHNYDHYFWIFDESLSNAEIKSAAITADYPFLNPSSEKNGMWISILCTSRAQPGDTVRLPGLFGD